MKALLPLSKYLARHKPLLILGSVLTLLAAVLAIVPARLVEHTLNLVLASVAAYQQSAGTALHTSLQQQLTQELMLYGGLIFLAAGLKGALSFFARRSIMVVGKRIEYALKNDIYAHCQTLPLHFYRMHSTGDLMARISEDVQRVGMCLGAGLFYSLNTIFTFLLLLPYMLVMNTRLALYAILPIPPFSRCLLLH